MSKEKAELWVNRDRSMSKYKKIIMMLSVVLLLVIAGCTPEDNVYNEENNNLGLVGAENGIDVGEPVPSGATEIFYANFETGLQGFGNRGTASLSVVRENLREEGPDNQVMFVSARGELGWHGARAEIGGLVVPEGEYFFEAWIYGTEPANYIMSLHVEMTGQEDQFPWVGNTEIYGQWVRISGQFTAPEGFNAIGLNFESSDSHHQPDFFVDMVRVYALSGTPIAQRHGGLDLSLTPLWETWEDYFLMGNIYTPAFPEDARGDLLLHHFNVITAENIMKPRYLQPSPGVFAFDLANAMIDFAQENQLEVVGHTLVWHEQSFTWIDEENTSREEAIEILENHIRTVVGHYVERNPGVITAWDVVNEAIDPRPGIPAENWQEHLRNTKWLRLIGPDYIEIAFRVAHEVDPQARLYYNDYNLNVDLKARVVAYMVRDLRDRGVPVTSIGMQGHYSLQTPINSVRNSLEIFSQIEGINVSITELDVTVAGFEREEQLPEQAGILQGQIYAQLFQIFREYSDLIHRVTFWGMADPDSWRADRHPNLFFGDLSTKLAFYGVQDPWQFLRDFPMADLGEPLMAQAVYGSTTIGDFNREAFTHAESIGIGNQMTAWEGAVGEAWVLWDEGYLYVLIEVQDDTPDVSGEQDHEQDSVEIFVSFSNSRSPAYQEGDYQLRVNRENYHTTGSTGSILGFESATMEIPGGYLVEVRIPLPEGFTEDSVIGFDLQVNDGINGERRSFAKWNDHGDTAWQSTEFFGNLRLLEQ